MALPLAFDILTKYDDKGLKQAGRDFDAFGRKSKGFGKNIGDNIRKGVDANRLGGHIGKNLGSGMRVGVGGPLKSMAGLMVGAFAAVSAVKVFGTFIGEARESAKIGRITAQVIKSTGGAAKITATQVGKLADTLSNKTAIDDEQIQAASNLLLTFKNVRNEVGKGNDIFNKATEAALDLSAAGFGSVESASKMLGKALNDPLKGITALSRAGVTFTDQQKKQIKTLVESGRTLEAQKIIMKEIASQVGGAAKAAADPLQRLKVIALNMAEAFGLRLLPFIEKAADWLGRILPQALDKAFRAASGFLSWFNNTFGPGIASTGRFIGDVFSGLFGGGGGKDVQTASGRLETAKQKLAALQDQAAKGMGGGAAGGIVKLGDVSQREWERLKKAGWRDRAGDRMEALYAPSGKAGKTQFARQIEQAQQEVEQAGKNLVAAEGKATKSFGKKIGERVGEIGRALIEKAKAWGGDLVGVAKTWGTSIINGVKAGIDTGNWRPLGVSLGSGLGQAFEAIVGLGGRFAATVTRWVREVDWIKVGKKAAAIAVPFAVGFANGLFDAIVDTIIHHPLEVGVLIASIVLAPAKLFKPIMTALRKIPVAGPLIASFTEGIRSAGRAILGAVGRFLDDVFVKNFMPIMRGHIIRLAKGFVREMGLLPTRLGLIALQMREKALMMMALLRKAIVDRIGAVVVSIRNLIGRMLAPFARASGWLLGKGRDFVAGLVRGIVGVLGTVVRAAARVISTLTLPYRLAGQWLVGRGREVVSGLIRGVSSVLGAVRGIAGRVISTVTSPFRGALGWLFESGRMILVGLRNGMFESLKNAGQWAASIGKRIVDAVKSFFGIKSPSTVFAGIGGQLMAGLAKGLIAGNPVALIGKIFGGMPAALGAIVSKGLVSIASLPRKALSALGKLGGEFAGLIGGAFGGFVGGSGVERWRGVALQALAMAGAPASWIGSLLRRMNQESGGNPKAINLWDSNAAKGIPSMGLMQTIGPTFNAYAGGLRSRGVWDPLANIYAAIRYTIARYGSGPAGWDRAGGYAMGGTINEPIFGVGRSGRKYKFGERGPETVIPGRIRTRGGDGASMPPIQFTNCTFIGTNQKQIEDLVVGAVDKAKRKGRIR